VAMLFDKLQSNAIDVADRHAPGTDSLKGKVAIVTGATHGVGLETARVLMKKGCTVIWAVRDVPKAEAMIDDITAFRWPSLFAGGNMGASGPATALKLDLADLRSVESFAKAFRALGLPMHYLINNAGIMMPALEKKYSVQKHELQFAVNHLAHFYLTRLLEDKLLETGTADEPARCIYLSTSGVELWNGPDKDGSMAGQVPPFLPGGRKYHAFHSYTLSKTLNVLTAKEQQRRWASKGSHAIALSLNPGLVGGITQFGGRTMLDEAGPLRGAFYGWPFAHAQKSTSQGAGTTIYAALSAQAVDEVRSGTFYFQNAAKSVPGMLSGHPEWFSEKLGIEVWDRTTSLLPGSFFGLF